MSGPGNDPHRTRSSAGFTIIELLIAAFVLVIVLGLASVFLGQQVQLQRAVQARNDVQDRVRVAAQLVTQDLSLAGAQLRIGDDGTIDTAAGTANCAQSADASVFPCVQVANQSPTASVLRMRYLSSQFITTEACRDVAYRLVDGVLQRSDVVCNDPDGFLELAPDMLGFKVAIVCSTGIRVSAFGGSSCAGTSYGRSAIVSVGAQSTIPIPGGSQAVTFVATTEDATTTPGITTVTCPTNRACYGVTQEVLIPNLKDR